MSSLRFAGALGRNRKKIKDKPTALKLRVFQSSFSPYLIFPPELTF
jgi:hypothetical protein